MHMRIPNTSLPPIRETSSRPVASPQLVKAANAFEANFLGELLKPLREDPLFGEGSGLGGDSLGNSGGMEGSMGTISSLASEAFAQALAKRGGLGIAKRVLAQLAPVEAAESQAADLNANSDCGGCTTRLTMGAGDAGSTAPGAIEMLGQGNLLEPTRNEMEKEPVGKPGGTAIRDGRSGSHPIAGIRAIGPATR